MAKLNERKKRRMGFMPLIGKRYYIYCEGEETEPNYFKGFRDAIEQNSAYRHLISRIEGVGKGTDFVVNKARDEAEANQWENAQIWCLFDKDDFPDDRFDKAASSAEFCGTKSKVEYHAGWSNECFELWFVLHFALYETANGREDYIRFLNKKFSEHNLPAYSKNNKEIFQIMTTTGSPKHAIQNAERLDKPEIAPSKNKPATKVYVLVKELAHYLPQDLRKRFLDD